VREPGHLTFLPDAGCEWNVRLQHIHEAATGSRSPQRLLFGPDDASAHTLVTDWIGLPERVVRCVGRTRALALLDHRDGRGDHGRRHLQEEYLEWRVVRDGDGCITRVEATTETREYWLALAAHSPQAVLDTCAMFAGVHEVDPADVFGNCDPLARGTTPQQRAAAFEQVMLRGAVLSPYNSGLRSICCMVHESNTLESLVRLASAALRTCTVDFDGTPERCLAADDLLPLLDDCAVAGRVSDPMLVERFTRLGWDGRTVAFDDPAGIYLTGAEHTRLRTPDGSAVPSHWFAFSRGPNAQEASDSRARCQRVVFEVPEGHGFRVGDLVDVATAQPINFGGQVAELLQVSVYVRVSERDTLAPHAEALERIARRAPDCDFVRTFEQAYPAA
jgi:hypothetical protein